MNLHRTYSHSGSPDNLWSSYLLDEHYARLPEGHYYSLHTDWIPADQPLPDELTIGGRTYRIADPEDIITTLDVNHSSPPPAS